MVIPQGLRDYIDEQVSDGSEVIATTAEDGYTWIITESSLKNWVTVVQWYEGMETYSIVNITGKTFNTLLKVLQEVKK